MNENKKLELLSKKLIKNSILKYSNISLFERREKDYKSEKKVKTKTPKLLKVIKSKPKNKEETKENILYTFCKTMSSFHYSDKSSNILPLLDLLDNDKSNISHRHKNKKKYNKLNLNYKTEIHNYLNKKNKINNTANNFYITETTKIKAENKKKPPKLEDISYTYLKEKNKKDDCNIDTLLLIQTYRNNENKNNNLKISSYFSDKKKTHNKHYSFIKGESNKNNFEKTVDENDIKHIINCKISKYDHYKEAKFKDFIKKTQELKIKGYAAKIKKERAIRLEEGYFNQIEFYQDTIQSLKSAQKLLDIQFSNKISDYTRFVMSKREREKVKSSKLIQEIINHRKDIEHIKNKINKIEIEKSNIIKWIYFMIQMKEKKLILPSYYKTFLEKGKVFKRTSRKQVSRRDEKSLNRGNKRQNTIRKPNSLFQVENKTLNDKNFIKECNKDVNKYSNRESYKDANKYSYIKESNKDIKKFIDINKDNDIYENDNINNSNNQNKKEIYKKINNYKNNLIFQTAEELQDRLSIFEKENLLLLSYNNELNHQLFKYKKELNLLLKDENNINSNNYQIKEKEKELENIKNIIKAKIKLISDFKKTEENLEIEFKKERDKRKINKKNKIGSNIIIPEQNNNSNKNKNTLLYRKINIIFESCKIIGCKLKYAAYILTLVNKKIYTKEKEMIFMLEFIEQTVDYLITNFNYYLNKNEEIQEFIKNIKSDIEKEHKIEKARLQMMIDLQKIKTLKEKVEKRSNKIYFLPSKKIDLNKFKIKKEKVIVDKDLNRIPTIEDYLYNEKEVETK